MPSRAVGEFVWARELLRAAQRERASSRFSQLAPGLEFLKPFQLLVDALQGRNENLLALERVCLIFRRAAAARFSGTFGDASLAVRERPFLVAKASQYDTQILQCRAIGVSNRRMV